ncbi:MAG: hypothetical protein HY731_04760 [Candidatus Tectomicrobia bacterium]|nr:hypothetical protein [Candidatus Tectomicrobia bacterium]
MDDDREWVIIPERDSINIHEKRLLSYAELNRMAVELSDVCEGEELIVGRYPDGFMGYIRKRQTPTPYKVLYPGPEAELFDVIILKRQSNVEILFPQGVTEEQRAWLENLPPRKRRAYLIYALYERLYLKFRFDPDFELRE